MHELALCQGLMDLLVEQGRAHGFTEVRSVKLAIGALGHVDPEALAFCFDVVTAGTLAEGAVLQIERPDGTAHCVACEIDVTITSRLDACPRCGGAQLLVTGGQDMQLRELEVR
jgi:hydrogenase nickel incorporation protein HypA/HybF